MVTVKRVALGLLFVVVALVISPTVAIAEEAPGWEPYSLNGKTPDTPAMIRWGSGELQVVRGEDSAIWWSDSANDNWRPIPGGWRTIHAPALALVNGQPWVFIRGGSDTRIYYARLTDIVNNQWTPWTGVPGSDAIGTPSVVAAQGRVYVFYTNSVRRIIGAVYGLNPAGWVRVNLPVPAGALTASSPAATVYGPNRDRIALFHRGTDDHIYRQNYFIPGDQWENHWTGIGATTFSRPAAATTGSLGETVEVAVRGDDNVMWLLTYQGDAIIYGWHPTPGRLQTTHAPTLFEDRPRNRIYAAITRNVGDQIWGKRVF